jgi:hydrogenase/urease accessory protein HupE
MQYTALGIEHILGGIDHLLFVAGLLILAGSWRRVLAVITGFTLAHSVTLSLSALEVVFIPVPPVEAGIALSIVFLAREIAVPRSEGLARRYPVLVSSSFGLLHGLGFAAALSEIGLQSEELLTSLFTFNIGVEVGQLLVILPPLVLVWAVRRVIPFRHLGAVEQVRPVLARLSSYAIGIPASFWFIQRMASFAL